MSGSYISSESHITLHERSDYCHQCAGGTTAIKSLLPPIDHVSTLEVGKAFSWFAELKRLVIIIRYMRIVRLRRSTITHQMHSLR